MTRWTRRAFLAWGARGLLTVTVALGGGGAFGLERKLKSS